MENELMNPDFGWWSEQICSSQTKFAAENVEGFEQSMKKILKIIEDGNTYVDGAQINYPNRNELIALLEEINQKHQLLAGQYKGLFDNLHCNLSLKTQKEDFAATVHQASPDSSLLSPDQKLVLQKVERHAVAFDFPLSSGGSSFVNSGKEGSESSALLSSDSDSESFNLSPNKGFTAESLEILKEKYVDMETGLTGIEQVCIKQVEQANGLSNARGFEAHGTMFLRITQYEEELRVTRKQLLSLEQEVMRLKSELKNALVAMDDSKAKLVETKNEVKMREDDLDVEKRKVSELQMQVAEFETDVLNSGREIGKLVQELEATSRKLESSEGKLAKLKHKIFDRDDEITRLNVALRDASRETEKQKVQFRCHNSSLSKDLTLLEAKLAEREEQIKLLKNEVKICEISKLNLKSSYETQEIGWRGEIEGLNEQLNEKRVLVESMNEAQDALKLKYDMLMVEKDGLIAQSQTFGAGLCSAEYAIQQMEGQVHQLQLQNAELITGSETMLKLRDELGLKVEKLEEEVERQAAMIKDRAEEKREAIRQLCFSLEHYRSGYNEIREAYIGQMKHVIIAS